jgi:hypothetical protein
MLFVWRVGEVAGLLLAWSLVSSPVRAEARAGCVELVGDPPAALVTCVTAEKLCESYQRALAADGGDDPQLAELRWKVRLRAQPAAQGEMSLALDAFAKGRLLGRRTLAIRERDCAAVPDALALVLLLLAREAESTVPEPPPSAATMMPPSAAAAPRAPTPQPHGVVELGAGAAVIVGALPAAAFGLQLQAATRTAPIAIRLRAAWLWPQELAVEEGVIAMRSYELAIEACSGLELTSSPRLALSLCAGPRAGVFHAAARGFTVVNHRADEFLLYFGALPEVSLALGPATWLRFGAGGAVALVHPRFHVGLDAGARSLALSAPGWLRAELGLTLVQNF